MLTSRYGMRAVHDVEGGTVFTPRALSSHQQVPVGFVDDDQICGLNDAALDALELVARARRRAQRVGDGDLERGELLGEEGRRHVLGRARGRQLRRVSAVQLPGRAEQRRGRREAGQLRQAQVDRVVPRLQPYV